MNLFIFHHPIQDICYLTYISCETNRQFTVFHRIKIFLPVSTFYITYIYDAILFLSLIHI